MKSEELKKAREQQVLDRRKCQAIEIQREKEETERINRVNQESLEREKQEEQRRRCVSFLFSQVLYVFRSHFTKSGIIHDFHLKIMTNLMKFYLRTYFSLLRMIF